MEPNTWNRENKKQTDIFRKIRISDKKQKEKAVSQEKKQLRESNQGAKKTKKGHKKECISLHQNPTSSFILCICYSTTEKERNLVFFLSNPLSKN